MSATVVDLATHRRNKRDLPGVKDSVAQVIMEHFKQHPVADIAAGIHAANRVIDGGGSFLAAMDSAEKTIQMAAACRVPDQNAVRLALFHKRRERRIAVFMELAECVLRMRLGGRPESEITAALDRARRVLNGGGTLCVAMYHALGDEVFGPEAG